MSTSLRHKEIKLLKKSSRIIKEKQKKSLFVWELPNNTQLLFGLFLDADAKRSVQSSSAP